MIEIDMKMPENCSECKIEKFTMNGYTCQITEKRTTGVREAIREKNCPLVEIQDAKADPDEIYVGDEVKCNGSLGVVIWVGSYGIEVMWDDGSTGFREPERLKKTGRYYDEISAVMKKLKEAANEEA